MTDIFHEGNTFLLQLPYLNEQGNPIVIRTVWHDAERLVKGGTHKILGGPDLWVLSPKVPAVVKHQFQLGEEVT